MHFIARVFGMGFHSFWVRRTHIPDTWKIAINRDRTEWDENVNKEHQTTIKIIFYRKHIFFNVIAVVVWYPLHPDIVEIKLLRALICRIVVVGKTCNDMCVCLCMFSSLVQNLFSFCFCAMLFSFHSSVHWADSQFFFFSSIFISLNWLDKGLYS